MIAPKITFVIFDSIDETTERFSGDMRLSIGLSFLKNS